MSIGDQTFALEHDTVLFFFKQPRFYHLANPENTNNTKPSALVDERPGGGVGVSLRMGLQVGLFGDLKGPRF